jgi:PAS domain S-box-containing protein
MPATAQIPGRQADAAVGRAGQVARPPRAGGPEVPRGGERRDVLLLVGVGLLFGLVVVALHLCASLGGSLERELAERLRVSARLATRVLPAGPVVLDPMDPELLARLEEVRASTAVTDVVLYDAEGELVLADVAGSAVPRRIRIADAERATPADPASRVPEWDPAGGLSLVVPIGGGSGVGALLVRIGREGQGGLATARSLFQAAKGLGALVIVSGLLVVVRWLFRGGPTSPAPVPAAGSDVDLVLGTMKEVVSTLKDSETRYRHRATAAEADAQWHRVTHEQVLASVPSGIVAFDVDGRVTQLNRSAEMLLATERRHAIGRTVGAVLGRDDALAAIAEEVVLHGRTAAGVELQREGDEGEPRWIGASSSVIRASDGTLLGGILLVTDLTETKRLREQMGLKDRLSAIGEMSAGIAHEIKNSLHSLNGLANLVREDLGAADPGPAVGGILAEVRSLESLVREILEFSKPSQLHKQAVVLDELLRETEASIAAAARDAGVAVRLELGAASPVLADRDALRRVFLNLALNAVEAMKAGGALTITSRSSELPDGEAKVPAVRIAFRDTGPGIPDADRARVFTPFYSTKREGSGLGLALAHKTVTDHGGRLSLHSRVGVGTEFVVQLPKGESA